MLSRVTTFAALFCLVLTTTTKGAIYTSNGDFQLLSPQDAADPPVHDIKFLTGTNGFAYTNQFSGAPFAIGSEIRTVTIQTVLTAQDGTNQPVTLPDGTSNLVVFAALRGTIIALAPGGSPVVSFTDGRAFASSSPNVGGLTTGDPSTWAASFAARFSDYALKPQEEVISGFPDGKDINSPASGTNVSGANIFAGGPLPSSLILFKEASSAAQNASAVPGGALGTGGNNFLSNVQQIVSDLNSLDSLISTPQQSVSLSGSTGSGFNAADLAVLNSIATAAFGLAFATDLTTPGPGYTVTFGANNVPSGRTNGDFGASITGDIVVGQQVIPEPSMLMIFGSMFALAASYFYRRAR